MINEVFDTTARVRYVDRKELLRSGLDEEGYRAERQYRLNTSTTLYIGNLSFYVTEEQIYRFVKPFGPVKQVTMVLNAVTRTPCGSCFVVFWKREDAELAHSKLQGVRIDDREVTVGWDTGLDEQEERRRWGRGKGGGMVVDTVRSSVDEGRGGLGQRVAAEHGIISTVVNEALVEHSWVPTLVEKRK